METGQPFIGCMVRELPLDQQLAAAHTAISINPVNRPEIGMLATAMTAMTFGGVSPPDFLAVLTSKWWHSGGVNLSVQFLDNPPASVRRRILEAANLWNRTANVAFSETSGQGQIRITRTPGQGYYSFLGTDILHIPPNQPTMNLDSFSDRTSDAEVIRVVCHEFFHSAGGPHEHARREIIQRLNPAAVIAEFRRSQGWSEEMIRQQILTPLDESSYYGTEHAEETSIMTYSFPASVTIDGRPILGGSVISEQDYAFAARIYPKAVQPPPPPPPPPPASLKITVLADVPAGTYTLTRQ